MKSIYLCVFLLVGLNLKAQIAETENSMLWTTLGVSKKINDNLHLSYNQLHSFSHDDSRVNFIQPDLGLSYKLTQNLDARIGYSPTFSLDEVQGNQLLYHRISGRLKMNTKISKRIRMRNSFTAEHHFTQRSKFKQRYYYRLDLYYRNTKLPWRLRPFADQKLYWYSNGRPLQYYDINGEPTTLESPNGLHAYRIKAGIKLYPSDKFIFSIYFLKQKEFNSDIFNSKDINSINPNSNSVRRRFYNFSVIGLSCTYKL